MDRQIFESILSKKDRRLAEEAVDATVSFLAWLRVKLGIRYCFIGAIRTGYT